MSHLSPSEFIDLADGSLPADRDAHLRGCERCRAQAEIVRDALRLADGSAPVPEPSPLFWDHLSARVRDAVAATPPRTVFGFGLRGVQPVAAVLVAAVLVFSAVFLSRAPRPDDASQASLPSVPLPGDPAQPADPPFDAPHAAEWAVLTAAAADLQLDEARDAGMAVPSATVDHAVSQLTRDELSELGRLLQSELKRSGD